MISIHILNAGHGDSIVLEYHGEAGPVYGVIDSNKESGQIPPALNKLHQLGADRLSFVALTHPHADHYRGLLDILVAYRGNISNFYSYPLDHAKEGRLRQLAEVYTQVFRSTDGKTSRANIKEYLLILNEIKENIGLDRWEEHTGIDSAIVPEGFAGVDIRAILPLNSAKGQYFQLIQNESPSIVENQDLNALSIAYNIIYKGREIILGGDVPYENWLEHKRQNARRVQELQASVVKLPHHGSKKDCKSNVVEYMFNSEQERYACISANGRSHPHRETLLTLRGNDIHPYCTNLAVECGAQLNNVSYHDSTIDPGLLLLLNRGLDEIPGRGIQPCQGDITIIIDDDGQLSVNTEHEFPCGFRDELDFLAQ